MARLKSLGNIRGIILGTPGAGLGLDHENVRDVLAAIEDRLDHSSGSPIAKS